MSVGIERIVVNPITLYNYAAFYIEGLNRVFKNKLIFDYRPFKQLPNSIKQCLLFEKLEKQAKLYWEEYCSPESVIRNIFSRLELDFKLR
ncbi:MAG TPA: hypothetical protein PK191_03915 [Niabella sp.]|nr:hypothetical protein [Niabella sp.]HOZ97364.1 hypothetical protein [Niabella sp.]HQW15365.1 hypothetical protein [Niabella sp.]HQX20589.1 hypothetical protein [Niabella sp.]HQX40974.1 hypothetical protein [Niabella sp.]